MWTIVPWIRGEFILIDRLNIFRSAKFGRSAGADNSRNSWGTANPLNGSPKGKAVLWFVFPTRISEKEKAKTAHSTRRSTSPSSFHFSRLSPVLVFHIHPNASLSRRPALFFPIGGHFTSLKPPKIRLEKKSNHNKGNNYQSVEQSRGNRRDCAHITSQRKIAKGRKHPKDTKFPNDLEHAFGKKYKKINTYRKSSDVKESKIPDDSASSPFPNRSLEKATTNRNSQHQGLGS